MKRMRTKPVSVYLKPGEMHLAEEPSVVTTVLGSCVSVIMYSPRLKIGAISHVMLPKCKYKKNCGNDCMQCACGLENDRNRGCIEVFKYAACSIPKMLENFDARGIERDEIEVKLFGGSDMFQMIQNQESIVEIGKQNIETVLQGIESEKLRLVTYDLGGPYGRKIIFHTHTGEVFLKRLNKIKELLQA